jgi:hypothetical protein
VVIQSNYSEIRDIVNKTNIGTTKTIILFAAVASNIASIPITEEKIHAMRHGPWY